MLVITLLILCDDHTVIRVTSCSADCIAETCAVLQRPSAASDQGTNDRVLYGMHVGCQGQLL